MSNRPDQQLEIALTDYTAALPRQARLIQLAGEVLRQLAAVQAHLPPARSLTEKDVTATLAAGEPLFATMPISAPIFQNTLGRLLDLFRQFELLPSLPPDLLSLVVSFPPQTWLGETHRLEKICQEKDVPVGLLLFIGQKALSPFYQEAAAPYASLFSQGDWQKRNCPGCGREPTLASLAPESRQRLLYCSLCAAQWPFTRQACIFCGNQEHRFSYIFAEDDPARRADLCQTCHRYLKTIVSDRLPHPLYLPLEEFVTVDLDTLLARDDLLS
jgi:hypothetical protein